MPLSAGTRNPRFEVDIRCSFLFVLGIDLLSLQVFEVGTNRRHYQGDPPSKSFRYKSWPYFKDWEFIFGKDRATGEVAQTWQDVVNDDDVYRPKPVEEETPLDQDETQTVNISAKNGDGASATESKKRKRSRVSQPQNPQMVEMMSSVLSEMNSQIGALVMKVGAEKDLKGQRQNLVNELANTPLTLEDKITVAKKICENVKYVDIFYGLGE